MKDKDMQTTGNLKRMSILDNIKKLYCEIFGHNYSNTYGWTETIHWPTLGVQCDICGNKVAWEEREKSLVSMK